MSKFLIGDIVKIRDSLEVGKVYYMNNSSIGDKFTTRMRNNMLGKEAKIIEIRENGGYTLDQDRIHVYYDDMLELATDIAEEPYIFNLEVEKLILHMERQYYKGLIDKALDERLHETDPEAFKELFEMCKQFI